jgi:phenylpropionate dioxygenase-like ring-hydroxylating dioxygenase large terminal subunit
MLTVEEIVGGTLLDASLAPGAEGIGLPRECYTSQAFYDFEIQTIFSREWLCLGRADEIPNAGDYFTVTVGADPLIVVRDETGGIHVLSAVCRHRGMVICSDSGNCGGHLTCPYHAWSYDTSGRLTNAPDMQRSGAFDRSRIRLPELRAEVWQGFVFVNFDLDAAPLKPRMAEVDSLLANYAATDLVSLPPKEFDFEANWKIVMENGIECYHCSRTHRGYHDCAPSRNTLPEPLPESDCAIVMLVKTTHQDAAFIPPDYKAVFPPLPGLTIEQRNRMMWVAVPPNVMLSCQPDNVHYFLWWPLGPELVRLKVGWLYPTSTVRLPDFKEKFQVQLEGQTPIVEQDAVVCKEVQRGLRSRLAERGHFSWQEETVAHFDRWLVDRYKRFRSATL